MILGEKKYGLRLNNEYALSCKFFVKRALRVAGLDDWNDPDDKERGIIPLAPFTLYFNKLYEHT